MKKYSNNYFINFIIVFYGFCNSTVKAETLEINNGVLTSAYSNSVIDYGQVVYGTLVVFAILGLVIFLLKKLRLNKFGQQGLVEVISSFPITTKDKLLIIRAGQEYLLLGVSSGGINKIHTLAVNNVEKFTNPDNSRMSSFSNIYAATIGKLHHA